MSSETPIVIGYYRYTDIWFEWHKVLPDPEDGQALKAILAHDTLVHPDHPLRREGVDGAELFLGTFKSGEARLLFSSAQVDYLRYWLHAMGLTKEIIPLLYSDCLLTTSNLKSVSPVVYKTGGDVRQAIKAIEKNNKRLKGSKIDSILDDRRSLFERGRNFWAQKKGVWCSMDFEDWERDHNIILEFGWRSIGWKDGKQIEKQGHLMPYKAKKYWNSTYVPDFRNHYKFGETRSVPNDSFVAEIRELVEELKSYGPVFFVFHDGHTEVKDLKALGVNLEGIVEGLPAKIPDKGLFVVDTADLIPALLGEGGNQKRSLDGTCKLLKILPQFLHNAGNDAHYTLEALVEMLSGDPVDTQREKRWPNQTPAGIKVELQGWQEDSDFDDQEGLFPPAPKGDPDTDDDV